MQDILGRDGFPANAALGKGDIFGDGFVEVVTHHQHVEVFFERVHSEGPRRVGRGRQHMLLAADLDDIGGMATACAFGVKGMDRAAFHGLYGMFDKTRFIERIGVDHHLHIHRIGNPEAAVDGGGGGAPVLVQLQRAGARVHLFLDGSRQRGIPFACKGEVHRKRICGLHHTTKVPGTGGAGGGQGPMRWPGASAQHGGETRMQCILDLLRADIMDVAVKPTRREDAPFARDHLGTGANDNGHIGLGVGVSGFADGMDAPILQADVGLVDAGPIKDQRIGDHSINRARRARGLCLPHPVTDHLTAAEFHLLTVRSGEVAFHLDDQVSIGQPHAVPGGGAIHGGIVRAGDFGGHVGLILLF